MTTMRPNDYAKLEKNYDFKKRYLNKTLWWKNISLLPPVLLLFVGLVGIIYLLRSDMLVSFYIIPYLLLFVLGTIWLKALKRHIQKTLMAVPDTFHLCLAKPLEDKNGYIFVVFVNNQNRHDLNYISRLAKTLDFSMDKLMNEYHTLPKKKSILISDDDLGTSFYIRAFLMKDIDKLNAGWEQDDYFPVMFINEKDTFAVKKKDLLFYSREK